ncbi:right-handed parallel beta-helix repeat-containing protein [Streptomyces sp. NRRL S-646]|uniref:pectate lyase family protein n=1 Tax=Streptomyces sp. NRRL S-646 TaxID=1463917 RepID=UPI00099B7616|nr:right-handed parallel beta-helix repeat-containing protein [Streptomyces sp. NRRL S-646]
MTQHLHSKRLPRSGAGKVLAAVIGLAAALSLGTIGQARAVTPAGAPATVSPDADRFSDRPHGFASLAGGTTGGAGGKVVTVTDQASLAKYAAAEEPYIIRVSGSIAVEPFGSNIVVGSNKTVIGIGDTGEIVHGELHLDPGTHNVIIRNLTIRDSYVEGDWDGRTQDFDAIQMDTVDHVWIDHNRLTHMGDGLIDLGKDSQYITVSYSQFSNHNKAFGIGWTTNVKTQVTIDHNWITRSKVVSDAPEQSFHLGRPWHPGGEPEAVAEVLIRDTELPAAVKSAPWTDMSGFSWKDARFAEYRNFGPGAGVTADRPQMSDADARTHTVADYLKGDDNWAPHARR